MEGKQNHKSMERDNEREGGGNTKGKARIQTTMSVT